MKSALMRQDYQPESIFTGLQQTPGLSASVLSFFDKKTIDIAVVNLHIFVVSKWRNASRFSFLHSPGASLQPIFPKPV